MNQTKAVIEAIRPWRHEDVYSCLHSCLGTVLEHYGLDPVVVLGSNWDFYYLPGDFRREEYYYPCRFPSLSRSLMPYHPVRAEWRHPTSGAAGWDEVKAAIGGGIPAIVAVDNYYLPFRPAYHDIHANHLVVVYGYDETAGTAQVIDPTPPYCFGPVDLDDLRQARWSGTPGEGRDSFFADIPVAARWLEVTVTGACPPLTWDWVKGVVTANLERFADDGRPAFSGLAGLRRYLDDLCRRAGGPGPEAALEEAYVVGWPLQAACALQAEFLGVAARELGRPELAEAGRRIDRLAHHWTALRVTGAHGQTEPEGVAPRLAHRAELLLHDLERALRELGRLVDWRRSI